MREYIRHPTSVPINLHEIDGPIKHGINTLSNVSFGGVSCICEEPVEAGSNLHIRIDCVDPDFEVSGTVVWCRPHANGYEVGIQFLVSKDKMFLFRMVEQLCHIEHYRHEVDRKEGRQLSSEEAASEWIARYADKFPAN
ncbi:MAG: PilZ domain-containing protein [Pseudomonadota bacterium]